MKKAKIFFLVIPMLIASACSNNVASRRASIASDNHANTAHKAEVARGPQTIDAHGHSHGASADGDGIPAFETDPKNLPPTLDPSKFKGPAREAYLAVREIPETIAQLPCYCHCDESIGHKSLHSCYVDDHAAMCDICQKEAIIAYRLEKQEKLSPEQIRERIIEQYGKLH